MCILSQCVYKTSGRKMKLYNSFMCLDKTLFFSFCLWGGGGGGERGIGGRAEREKRLAWSTSFFQYMQRKFINNPKNWNITIY